MGGSGLWKLPRLPGLWKTLAGETAEQSSAAPGFPTGPWKSRWALGRPRDSHSRLENAASRAVRVSALKILAARPNLCGLAAALRFPQLPQARLLRGDGSLPQNPEKRGPKGAPWRLRRLLGLQGLIDRLADGEGSGQIALIVTGSSCF